MSLLKVGLIGCGRVGLSFATNLKRAKIIGVNDLDSGRRKKASILLGCPVKDLGQLAKTADVILIATGDDEIGKVARKLRRVGFKKTLIHFSGLLSSKILGNNNRASIHPLGSFADTKTGKKLMVRTSFIIEGDRKGISVAQRLLSSFTDRFTRIKPEDKPYYHLACVFVSNLLIGLYSMGKRIVKKKKLDIDLLPLVDATVHNIKALGINSAITGPLLRKDVKTLRVHKKILKKMDAKYGLIYYLLSREVLDLISVNDEDFLTSELRSLLEP